MNSNGSETERAGAVQDLGHITEYSSFHGYKTITWVQLFCPINDGLSKTKRTRLDSVRRVALFI